jgi:hypothetical protein
MMGLSIGVHLLNLLTIPALGMVYYFRRYKFSWLGFSTALGASVVALAVVQYGIGIYTFQIAWWFEKTFTGVVDVRNGSVSGMGLSMGTGAMLWFALLFGGLAAALWYSTRKRKVGLNTILWSVVMVYIGISSYAMIFIRANANPPINENNPSNLQAFLSYMKREQYGDRPLFKGPMYNARPIAMDPDNTSLKYYKFDDPQDIATWGAEGQMLQRAGVTNEQVNARYVLYMEQQEYQYDPSTVRFFPRMHSREHYAYRGPGSYHNFVSEANRGADTSPNSPDDDTPSGGDNLKFFFGYQLNHMYFRYFGWNFIGRENDIQDAGVVLFRLPAGTPEEYEQEPSYNRYFGLPLLLGLFGLVWQYYRKRRDAVVMIAFFFFTGLAIIIYLNQTPLQPRERDYSYAGSFQAFAIWVGLGVLGMYELLNQYLRNRDKLNAYLAGGLCFLLVPFVMGYQNWDDHTRAGNYVAPDSARNLLESCARNAILFTNGDNDTFPLWYLQEVEGVRTDVRIINLSLLNTNWYIHQLRDSSNDAPPVPLSVTENYYMGERNNIKMVQGETVSEVLPVDVNALLANGVVSVADTGRVSKPMQWVIPTRGGGRQRYLQKQDLMIIDMLRNIARAGWNRPVYFAITIPQDSYIGLQDYFQQEGMAYRVVPIRQPEVPGQGGSMNMAAMYDNLMHKFVFRNTMPGTQVFLDSNIRRMMGNFRNNYLRLATMYINEAEQTQKLAAVARAAGQTAAADSLANLSQFYLGRTDSLCTYMEANIGDDVCPAESYIHSQLGQIYATLAKNGIGNTERAKASLALGLRRADVEIRYLLAGGQELGQRSPDLYAIQIAFMAYRDDLQDREGAQRAAALFKQYTGSDMLEQQLNAMPQPQPQTAPAESTAAVQ